MNIQIISYFMSKVNCTDYNIDCSTFDAPKAFDSYDINIISLQNSEMWKNNGGTATTLNCIKDLQSLRELIKANRNSQVVILLPMNYTLKYQQLANAYSYSVHIKDMLQTLKESILSNLINRISSMPFDFLFGITTSKCNNSEFVADFSFETQSYKSLTESKTSKNKTTIRISDKIILSTLKFDVFDVKLRDFLECTGLDKGKEEIPEWLKTIEFFDDEKQNKIVETATKEIDELQSKIDEAKKKLEENLAYKRALIDNNQSLVDVVFDILEKMLDCDLSGFVDNKKEDFLIKLEGVTFVGEIKGITSNVRNENISQASGHRDSYLDRLEDEGVTEDVRAILIVNTFRTKELSERDKIHDDQIEKAKRYECLIITTYELLKLFEAFLNNQVSTEQIINALKTKTGLLMATDCFEPNEDNSAYKI